MTKPIPISQQHVTTFQNISPQEMNEFIVTCFLNHDLKLIRNWGEADENGELKADKVTLLQFGTKTRAITIEIRPQQSNISIHRNTKNARKKYMYFLEILQGHRLRSKGSYKEEERN